MNVNVIGAGYVGLVTAVGLAHKGGHRVTCVESDSSRFEVLNRGDVTFFEPGLEKLMRKALKAGRLTFVSHINELNLDKSSVSMICVGTPSQPDGTADLTALSRAVEQLIASGCGRQRKHVVAIRSTVPPGTTDVHARGLTADVPGIRLVMSPEFLAEGTAVENCLKPDRIIIGTHDEWAWREYARLYPKLAKSKIIRSTPTEAELSKYANNSLLALLISFSNELALIANELHDVDIHRVVRNVLSDGRWLVDGKRPAIASYFYPGCGFGGSCFPKDIAALGALSERLGTKTPILHGILPTNAQIKSQTVKTVVGHFEKQGGSLKHRKISLLGLAFKPDTDDVRESPTLHMIEEFAKRGFEVVVHDYMAKLPARLEKLPGVTLTRELKKALRDSEYCVVSTTWSKYRDLKERDFVRWMRTPCVLDCRGMFAETKFKKVRYARIGAPTEEHQA